MTEIAPPAPYKFCELHMLPSTGPRRCQLCFPGTTSVEPTKPIGAPEAGAVTKAPVAEAPTPPLTDPVAQRVVQAAQDYARAVEAVTVITQQVTEAQELLDALKKKLKENKELADAAQNELREATTKK
jgi:ABC-type branched-subunit amino acid transport system substrate-binding protein